MGLEVSQLQPGKKIYFASDFHLGASSKEDSSDREQKLVNWLESIRKDAQQLFLVGDLFDFWYEYRHVVPKGHIRFLGKLAELSDQGIEVIVFCGNHDLWFKDYLTEEISARIIHEPISIQLGEKRFYIAHGDGLGPGGYKFKLIKSVFTNPLCKWMFGWVHPTIGFGLARFWSKLSKEREPQESEDEKLIIHSKSIERKSHHDFYVYGDCHLVKHEEFVQSSYYINLGDWISNYSYGVFDGSDFEIKRYSV